MSKFTNDQCGSRITKREPFENATGSFSGHLCPDGFTLLKYWGGGSNVGSLPTRFHPSIEGAEYVVRSYATPIAWFKNGEWFVPPTFYSMTTRKHQGYLWGFSEPVSDWFGESGDQLHLVEDVEWNRDHKTVKVHICKSGWQTATATQRGEHGWTIVMQDGHKFKVYAPKWSPERSADIEREFRRAIFLQHN